MASSNVTITPPDTDSAEAIADMWVSLADGQREFGSHIRGEANRAEIRQSVLRHIAGDRLLIARTTELCGFVMFSLEQGSFDQDVDRGIVENLYVRPRDRDGGIGTALLEAAERALRDRGVDTVSLNVMADNEAARRFYDRHGYQPYRVELEKTFEHE